MEGAWSSLTWSRCTLKALEQASQTLLVTLCTDAVSRLKSPPRVEVSLMRRLSRCGCSGVLWAAAWRQVAADRPWPGSVRLPSPSVADLCKASVNPSFLSSTQDPEGADPPSAPTKETHIHGGLKKLENVPCGKPPHKHFSQPGAKGSTSVDVGFGHAKKCPIASPYAKT